MYADRIAAGTKRSVKERLDSDAGEDLDSARQPLLKRRGYADDKWKHDLYESGRESPSLKSRVGYKDLRLKLQKKVSQQNYRTRKETGVRDLREKLSGIMHSNSINAQVPKGKNTPQSSIPVKKNVTSVEASAQETKKNSNQTYSEKKAKQKSESSIEGFLQSLELGKYIIMLKVDMAALKHMSENDLKGLGNSNGDFFFGLLM